MSNPATKVFDSEELKSRPTKTSQIMTAMVIMAEINSTVLLDHRKIPRTPNLWQPGQQPPRVSKAVATQIQ